MTSWSEFKDIEVDSGVDFVSTPKGTIEIDERYTAWQRQLSYIEQTSIEIPYDIEYKRPPVKRHQTPAELLDTLQYIKENY